MPDVDEALAQTAVGLNADSKAARKKAGKTATGGSDIVQEPAPGELDEKLKSLGAAVDQADRPDLSEHAHLTALDEAERAAAETILNPRALVWDLRDAMLEQYKRRPRIWTGLSEAEQRDVAKSFEIASQELVSKVVEAIAAKGQTAVRVLLKKVTLGDDIGIVGTVKTSSADEEDVAVGILHSARGKHVMLTVASKDDYEDQQREAEIDPDEQQLDFEAGGPPADDSDLAAADLEPLAEGQRVNLKTSMIEEPGPVEGDWLDVREATPAELAAERERTADFPPAD